MNTAFARRALSALVDSGQPLSLSSGRPTAEPGGGFRNDERLELVQIMELCDSMTTAWEKLTPLELNRPANEP